MYVGEVEVKQTDLAGLIEVAENLGIKGLAIPDVDHAANEQSQPHQNILSKSNEKSGDFSVSLDPISVVHSPSPPRKRKRIESGDKGKKNSYFKSDNSYFKVEVPASMPSHHFTSSIGKNSLKKDKDQPDTPLVGQIKGITDIQNQGNPSDLNYGKLSYENNVEFHSDVTEAANICKKEDDHLSDTKICFKKEELHMSCDEDWIDSIKAGPSGLNKEFHPTDFLSLETKMDSDSAITNPNDIINKVNGGSQESSSAKNRIFSDGQPSSSFNLPYFENNLIRKFAFKETGGVVFPPFNEYPDYETQEKISESQHQMGPTKEPFIARPKKKINKKKSKLALTEKGQAYVRNNGTIYEKMEFEFVSCKCSYGCRDVDIDTRKILFDQFWKLGSWDSQTSFLVTTTKQVILLLFKGIILQ